MPDREHEKPEPHPPAEPERSEAPAGATKLLPKPKRKPRPKKTPPKKLPPWHVILHNDDVHDMGFVVETILMLTPLTPDAAFRRMLQAHHNGQSLLLSTHQERAELYRDQFTSRGLTVTIEPAK